MSVNSARSNYNVMYVVIDGKRKEIDKEMKDILTSVSLVEDHYILDHTIAILTQLSRTLYTHLERSEDSNVNSDFPIKDHFAPSQKNEKQVIFKRTTAPAGRKKKDLKLQ